MQTLLLSSIEPKAGCSLQCVGALYMCHVDLFLSTPVHYGGVKQQTGPSYGACVFMCTYTNVQIYTHTGKASYRCFQPSQPSPLVCSKVTHAARSTFFGNGWLSLFGLLLREGGIFSGGGDGGNKEQSWRQVVQ